MIIIIDLIKIALGVAVGSYKKKNDGKYFVRWRKLVCKQRKNFFCFSLV